MGIDLLTVWEYRCIPNYDHTNAGIGAQETLLMRGPLLNRNCLDNSCGGVFLSPPGL